VLSGFNKFAHRPDLLGNSFGMEIIHGLKTKFNRYLGIIVSELVVYSIGDSRFHAFQHIIEVVTVDLNEFSLFEFG